MMLSIVPILGTVVEATAMDNVVCSVDRQGQVHVTLPSHSTQAAFLRQNCYTFQDMAGNPGRGSINEEFLRQYTAGGTHADTRDKFRRGQPTRKTASTFWDENPYGKSVFADIASKQPLKFGPEDLDDFLRHLDEIRDLKRGR